MSPQQVIKKLKSGDLHYALGRFRTVRKVHSMQMGMRQKLRRPAAPFEAGSKSEFFPNLDVDESITSLRRDAVCFKVDLSPEVVKEIHEFAKVAPLRCEGRKEPVFFSQVKGGRLPDGEPFPLGHVNEPKSCPALKRMAEDEKLWRICIGYLGYTPPQAEIFLYWSFASDMDAEARRKKNQTIDYHYDVHDYNFCYAHIYITDCDEQSGAHVMVRGSHTNKRFSWLLGSARKSDAEILSYYDPKDVLVIKGPAGTGFIEDTSCLHKAMAPVTGDRLLLQVRYH